MTTERDVIKRLGITDKEMRQYRAKMRKGLHWSGGDGPVPITYTEAGIEYLTRMIIPGSEKKEGDTVPPAGTETVPDPDLNQAGLISEKDMEAGRTKAADDLKNLLASPPAEKKEGELTVTRANFRNTGIIQARTAAGEVVMVRVRRAGLYLPGMIFKALYERPGVFDEIRMPRARGIV